MADEWIHSILKRLSPQTVVDFGAGQGKYGRLCRGFYPSAHLVAVEPFEPTARFLESQGPYDQVAQETIGQWLDGDQRGADLAIFGDVLEHMPRAVALRTLDRAAKRFGRVLVKVPLRNLRQEDSGGNPFEVHRAYLTEHCLVRRYFMPEMHVLYTSPGYATLLGLIERPALRRWKYTCKEQLLLRTGRLGARLLQRFGFDSIVPR